MANEILQRNPTSTGNRRVFTWAGWVKVNTSDTTSNAIWHVASSGSSEFKITVVPSTGAINVNDYSSGAYQYEYATTRAFRDFSNWFHLVVAVDTTQVREDDRFKIYVNGVLYNGTYSTETIIGGINYQTRMNTPGEINTIGRNVAGGTSYSFKGQLSDVFMVDGQALTPDVFGFYKEGKGYISAGSTQATDFRPGQWVPKTPRVIKTEINRRGGFGVNGFYLPMNDSRNFGADFHCEPNSIITLNEKLPQPRVGVASTAAVGLGYTDVLRADPYAANLVLAVPGISTSTSANLVTNGNFDSNVTGWTAINATIAWSSGRILVTRTGGSGPSAYQIVTTEIGKRYTLSGTIDSTGTGDRGDIRAYSDNASTMLASASGTDNQVVNATTSFTATTTSTYIYFTIDSTGTAYFDNIVVREENVPLDYSAYIKGSGSNKTLTAVGNAGVGYQIPSYYGSALSFDGTDDRFTLASSSDFNFGTGDFTVEFWANSDNVNSTGTPSQLGFFQTSDTAGGIKASYTGGLVIVQGAGPSGGGIGRILAKVGDSSVGTDVGILTTGQWNHIALARKSGTATLYVNGVAVGVNTTATESITGTNLVIGGYSSTSYLYDGLLQDFRVYNTAKYKGGFDVPKPYTPVGIATWRAVPDTTANNFATWNPLANGNAINAGNSTVSYTNGNNTATWSGVHNSATFGTVGINTGKWYWETRLSTVGGSYPFIGISSQSGISSCISIPNNGIAAGNSGVWLGSGGVSAGDIVGIALSFTSAGVGSTITFYINNVAVTNTSYIGNRSLFDGKTDTWVPSISGINGTVWDVNFGQNPTFSGNTTAGTFTDSNGKGLFKYQPPSGFLALCEDNLPTPAISDPGDYFKTVLYTGDGNSGRSIVGVGFTPDLVWIKRRLGTSDHVLQDSVRGFGPATKLASSSTQKENDTTSGGSFGITDPQWGYLTSANYDGFSLAVSSGGGFDQANKSGETYTAWCWRAGAGTTSTNTDGSIQSVVSVNQTAGFSIVSYTGNGTIGATVGHGLGKTPDFLIVKRRNAASAARWAVLHKSFAANQLMALNLTNAIASETAGTGSTFNITKPTSTVITLGDYADSNASGSTYIAYCWAEIENFSKFGNYVGNGNADGVFVYTGGKPALVMIKRTDSTGSWVLKDSSRNSTNPSDLSILVNTSDTEYSNNSPIDFLSNGFKLRSTSLNDSGGTFIYACFMESPFTTANAK